MAPFDESLTAAKLRVPDLRGRIRAGRRSALARACGAARGLRVHDAFAGWGTDGLVLAALGCHVHMSEREPAVHQVLSVRVREFLDGARASGPVTCAREDAACRWSEAGVFDVIYLDPMFVPHPKSAAPSKPMRALARFARAVTDDELGGCLNAARRAAAFRVVVKRRARAPALGGAAPQWSVGGKRVRFDIYLPVAPGTALDAPPEAGADRGASPHPSGALRAARPGRPR